MKKASFLLILFLGINMTCTSYYNTINEIVAEWKKFIDTHTKWQTLIHNHEPRISPCGLVYELPNFLNRANEDFAIVDMSGIAFAQPHYHPEGVVEIYFVLQGSGIIVVDNQKHVVSPGDVVVIPPKAIHFTIPNDDFIIAVINTPPFKLEHYIPAHTINIQDFL